MGTLSALLAPFAVVWLVCSAGALGALGVGLHLWEVVGALRKASVQPPAPLVTPHHCNHYNHTPAAAGLV